MFLQNVPSPRAWGRHRSPWNRNDSSLTFRKVLLSSLGENQVFFFLIVLLPLTWRVLVKLFKNRKRSNTVGGTGLGVPALPLQWENQTLVTQNGKVLRGKALPRGKAGKKNHLIFPQRVPEWPIIKIIATNYCQCLLLTKFIQDMYTKYNILHAIPQWKSTTPAWWQFSSPTPGEPDKRTELTHLSSPACWYLSALRTYLTMKLPAEITSSHFMKYWHRQYFRIHSMAWS